MKITDVHSPNHSSADHIKEDVRIHYKGHGKLESAPTSSSIIHVIAHELDHVTEFKARAVRDKVDIRNLDMKINFEFRDGKLVAVGGKTQVTTSPRPRADDDVDGRILTVYEELKKSSRPDIIEELQVNKSEESFIRDRLGKIQLELKTILTKALYNDPEHVTLDSLKDEKKQETFKEIRSKLQKELEELKQREESERSKHLLLEIAELQNTIKSGFLDPEKLSILIDPEAHLDLLI